MQDRDATRPWLHCPLRQLLAGVLQRIELGASDFVLVKAVMLMVLAKNGACWTWFVDLVMIGAGIVPSGDASQEIDAMRIESDGDVAVVDADGEGAALVEATPIAGFASVAAGAASKIVEWQCYRLHRELGSPHFCQHWLGFRLRVQWLR